MEQQPPKPESPLTDSPPPPSKQPEQSDSQSSPPKEVGVEPVSPESPPPAKRDIGVIPEEQSPELKDELIDSGDKKANKGILKNAGVEEVKKEIAESPSDSPPSAQHPLVQPANNSDSFDDKQPPLPPLPEDNNSSPPSQHDLPRPASIQRPMMQQQTKKKDKLKSLFLKYAEVSDETGISCIKSRQFIKLLTEAGVVDSKKVNKSKIDVIFSSCAGRKGMPFPVFLQAMIKVGEQRYPEISKSAAGKGLDTIVNTHLLPLYERITSLTSKDSPGTSIGKVSSAMIAKPEAVCKNLIYDQDVKIMLNSIFPVLKDVYDAYFGNPFKNGRNDQQIIQIASKQLLTFIREFDLSKANFISKQTALLLMESLVSMPDQILTNNEEDNQVFFPLTDSDGNTLSQEYGCYFTLNRFFVFLFWSAIIGFDSSRADHLNYSQAEKVYFLLTKMELSKGFGNLTKKYFKHYTSPHTMIPSPHIISKLVINNPLTFKKEAAGEQKSRIVEGDEKEDQIREKQGKPVEESESVNVKREEEKERIALEMCTDKLQRIFMWYCSISDSSNTNKMPMSKFMAFLKDSGLILGSSPAPEMGFQLSVTDAELVFAKVIATLNGEPEEAALTQKAAPLKNTKILKMYATKDKRAKMDFKAFYYAITIVASRVYPELPPTQAMIAIAERHVKALEERNSKVDKTSDLLKDMLLILRNEEVVELLSHVHKVVYFYFNAYTENSVMGYNTFLKFCRDFGIFPDICSKSLLHSTFYALAFANSRIIEGTNPSPDSKDMVSGSKSQIIQTSVDRDAIRTGEFLDQNLFVEALSLCALRSKAFEREYGPVAKILHLMEKIMQSQGIAKVKKMVGKTRISIDDIDPLIQLRTLYKEYFEKRHEKTASIQQGLIDEVLADEDTEERKDA